MKAFSQIVTNLHFCLLAAAAAKRRPRGDGLTASALTRCLQRPPLVLPRTVPPRHSGRSHIVTLLCSQPCSGPSSHSEHADVLQDPEHCAPLSLYSHLCSAPPCAPCSGHTAPSVPHTCQVCWPRSDFALTAPRQEGSLPRPLLVTPSFFQGSA